jgi:prolyl 4-hydroxylase
MRPAAATVRRTFGSPPLLSYKSADERSPSLPSTQASAHPMNAISEAHRLAAAGRRAEGIAMIERAAVEGDVDALFMVAHWRLFAMEGPRDLAAAHRLLERAGEKGHAEATRTRATLIANGTGCPADADRARELLESIRDVDGFAALQLTFGDQMRPLEDFSAEMGEVLSESPFIKLVHGAFTEKECAYLRTSAKPRLQPSFVVDPASGRRMAHPVRTSTGTSFGPTEEDWIVRKLNERIARLSGTDVACGEPLHILCYAPGQEYKPHVDCFTGEDNQRDWTALVYLNTEYQGGETRFEKIGIDVRGQLGDVLVFRNVDEEGRGDPTTRHAGLPVTSGTKWLATRWIRRRPYHPWQD